MMDLGVGDSSQSPLDGGVPARSWTITKRQGFTGLGAWAGAATLFLALGVHVPYATPVLGLGVVVGIPTFLLAMTGVVPGRDCWERMALSAVASVGLIMGVGFTINATLPILAVARPLDPAPAMTSLLIAWAGLGAWAWPRHPETYRLTLPGLGRRERTLVRAGIALVALAVAGANRLNNGADGQVTWCMLVLAIVLLGLLMAGRPVGRPGVTTVCIFCVSLSLLFMTSLRGWYTTGHDVQYEYLLFEFTKHLGRWTLPELPSTYSACLSITVLPVMVEQWLHLADPYVFKVAFQVLFALCPVLVYRLASRVAPRGIALLAVTFFISFVTFFQDMPMLNRQEVAFLFLAAALVVAFSPEVPTRARGGWFVAFGGGMVVSHYSTTYVALGVLALAWGLRVLAGPACRGLGRIAPRVGHRLAHLTEPPEGAHALRAGPILVLIIAAAAWNGPVTQTQGALSTTLASMVASLRGRATATRSSDTSYSLFGGATESQKALLATFEANTLQATAAERARGDYYPLATVEEYPTPPVPEATLPLTGLGRALARIGLDPVSLNRTIRLGSAKALQVLVVIGLIAAAWRRRGLVARGQPEFFFLGVASLAMVVLAVVLPTISVDYGLLRAFQQALLVLGVFLAAGVLSVLPTSWTERSLLLATGVALAFLASSTGVLTQALGGYGPQLHLNNAGQYYDLYVTHPQELAGITWLNATIPTGPDQPQVQMDTYTYEKVQTYTDLSVSFGVHPLVVQPGAWAFLGSLNLASEGSLFVHGDVVTFRVPLAFFDATKDLVYDNGGARVYR